MDWSMQSSALLDTYWENQKLLWKCWVEIARRFEHAVLPEDSRSVSPLDLLDRQMERALDFHQDWSRLWIDPLQAGRSDTTRSGALRRLYPLDDTTRASLDSLHDLLYKAAMTNPLVLAARSTDRGDGEPVAEGVRESAPKRAGAGAR